MFAMNILILSDYRTVRYNSKEQKKLKLIEPLLEPLFEMYT